MTDQHTDFAEAFGLPGGPAYPISIPGSGDNGAHGMSLRDWFAGLAMMAGLGKAFTGAAGDTYDERVAKAAYGMADAMLKARAAGDTYDERVAKAAYGMADAMLKARRAE